jgi:glycosyltransferase involved in cell wall biosynthesis
MSTAQIKVLHLITSLDNGGIEHWLLRMSGEINRSHVQMDFCCKGATIGQLASQAEQLGAHVWHVPLSWKHHDYIRGLHQLLVEQSYDIVHNHMAVYAGIGSLVARQFAIPTIVSFHNMLHSPYAFSNPVLIYARELYGHASIRLACNSAKLVTGCSQSVVMTHVEKYGVPLDRTATLHYGVDILPTVKPQERETVRREIGGEKDAPMLVHVGRFVPQKNHVRIIDVAASVVKQRPDVVFVLVGDGPLRSDIEHAIAHRGLEHNVRLLGQRNDVQRILSAADIFFLPSHWEGLPVVALEAAAAGLPVVGADIPALQEAVINNVTGILVADDMTVGYTQALFNLIEDQDTRYQMGRKGYERIRHNFSTQKSAQSLIQTYEYCMQ